MSLDSSLLLNKYEIAPRSRYVFPADANNWFLNDFKYGRGRGLSLEETLRAELNDRVSILAGIVASDSDIIPKSTIPGGAQPGNVEAQGGEFVYFKRDANGNFIQQAPIRRVVRAQYQSYGGYVEMNWQASHALKTTFGARFDKDSRYGNTPFSPRVAAVYDFNDKLRMKYIFTRAYVAPAPYFGFATFDNGTLLATSNPNLRPETATAHEVNLSYAKRNLNLGLSVYRGRQNNLILLADRALPQNVIDPEVFVRDANGNFVPRQLVQTVNGGGSSNVGADFYGQTSFGRASVWFSYSYVDFKETTNGMTSGLPGISAHNVRLGGTYAATPKLYFTPSLVWRSTPRNVMGGALSSELSSPYEVNLHAGYTAGKNTEIFADIRNLTGHKYALGGIAGSAVPQEPFRAQLGVRHSF
jgi:outer membrane receptor for ferrienterochelin and colicin